MLNGVQIKGTLDFEDAELRADLNCRPIGFELIDHGSGEIVRASVYRASFAMVKVDGDMNLTGLNVRQTSI